jgi:SAM-dependent methyltransferase
MRLTCQDCGHAYPLHGGIVRTVPSAHYAGSFGYQWNKHRRTQLDSYTGLTLTRDRFFTATRWPHELKGLRVLEAGSGAGRFTEILGPTGGDIYTVDLSPAIEANYTNNSHRENVHFFQSDIYDLPFSDKAFDCAVCLGVIQHTPDPAKAFKSLARHVKPGGSLVIDCYAKNLRSMLSWKYVLRPITRRMGSTTLYSIIERVAPTLVPVSAWLRKRLGPAGARIIPILQYEHWGLPSELNRQWAILDTFDMYSPRYDQPQTLTTIREWYRDSGFVDIDVRYGLNGIVASGRRSRDRS